MNILQHLEERATKTICTALGVEEAYGDVRPATDERFGDYQINGILSLAKQLRQNPRDMAQQVAKALELGDMCEPPEVAGPGFINLRLRTEWLEQYLGQVAADTRAGIDPPEAVERIVVDYSSPNVAKTMHVGHLRSTIIGNALCRILRFLGHHVIGDNHLGDWGTQFGLLILGFRRFADPSALAQRPMEELERIYQQAVTLADKDEAVAEEARGELFKLQSGDGENRALWERFVRITLEENDKIYQRLGVHFDAVLGESSYNDLLPGVVDRLLKSGIARESQGAICVFFEDDPELADNPYIVQKSDGAFMYSTTDIATIQYRHEHFRPHRILYVVDSRQALHFRQLFSVARKMGYCMRLEHIGFGTILGPDGRPIRTREGKAVYLENLLDEADRRAAEIIRNREDKLGGETQRVARAVGIGAVIYADLSQNRLSDYRFDWDKMLSFDGNTGPYLQYALVRTRSLFRKLGDESWQPTGNPLRLEHASENTLARELARFPEAFHRAAQTSFPHLICDSLYRVARRFSLFWRDCPVLTAEGPLRESRLSLCRLTGNILQTGLQSLGIDTLERM
ncbi:MAG: arginine--tRNA ligase [Deltaproteobacteria bacterium]|nr:arginine--tRNA ligase [Deltaproteobacteria bacterium]